MVLLHLMALASAMFNTPVLIGLMGIIFLASVGISLGVRRIYTNLLLRIFEVS